MPNANDKNATKASAPREAESTPVDGENPSWREIVAHLANLAPAGLDHWKAVVLAKAEAAKLELESKAEAAKLELESKAEATKLELASKAEIAKLEWTARSEAAKAEALARSETERSAATLRHEAAKAEALARSESERSRATLLHEAAMQAEGHRHKEAMHSLAMTTGAAGIAVVIGALVAWALICSGKPESAVQVVSIALSGSFGFVAGRSIK